jgi:hypothetical protein
LPYHYGTNPPSPVGGVLMSVIDGQGRVGGEALVPPGPRTSRRPSGLAFETRADGIDLAVDATGVGVRVVEQPGDQGRDGGHGNSFRGWGLGSRSASDARIRRTPTNCTRGIRRLLTPGRARMDGRASSRRAESRVPAVEPTPARMWLSVMVSTCFSILGGCPCHGTVRRQVATHANEFGARSSKECGRPCIRRARPRS